MLQQTSSSTDTINPKDYVAPGTGLRLFFGYVFFTVLFFLFTLISYGIVLLFVVVGFIVDLTRFKKILAQLKGTSVVVGPDQMPEIYEAAVRISSQIGLKECPDIYLVEGNQQNAAAAKVGSRKCVVLIDDIVYGAMATDNPKVLEFIIAHELAHHALGHTGGLRPTLTRSMKGLGRLDEFSCDAVANAVVGDQSTSFEALKLLLIGPQLFRKVNDEALMRQVYEVCDNNQSRKSEQLLTHPLLLRRMGAIMGQLKKY